VNFNNALMREYASEIAVDEFNHVKFLRSALGSSAVARPKIDLNSSFTALAQAAGLITSGEKFNPFLNEQNFLLGAFIFEDVGVTAYNGALALISDKGYLTAASSIMAVEAYHASEIRTRLLQAGQAAAVNKISALRAMLSAAVSPGTGDDQGISLNGKVKIRYHPALRDASRRTSFLKKRSKKLFSIWHCAYGNIRFLTPTEKSFLVLFFKKEHPCLPMR
jgi:hypothetical protein